MVPSRAARSRRRSLPPGTRRHQQAKPKTPFHMRPIVATRRGLWPGRPPYLPTSSLQSHPTRAASQTLCYAPIGFMISTVLIEGYRGLRRFHLDGLGRVNLLVGRNNDGKTSVLEALYLLERQGSPAALGRILAARGESLLAAVEDSLPRRRSSLLDIRHVFFGHDPAPGSRIKISVDPKRFVEFSIALRDAQSRLFPPPEPELTARLELRIDGDPPPPVSVAALTDSFGWLPEWVELSSKRWNPADRPSSQFITHESLNGTQLLEMWDRVALTPAEDLVLSLLRIIEPGVERVAILSQPRSGAKGSFIAKLKDVNVPVPIGTMGEGISRLLVLAITLAQCRDGVLLVDEIDTGLHYSVMTSMWRLIYEAAIQLNVQVFATTHSLDCVESLKDLEERHGHPLTIQRIDRGTGQAARLSYAGMVAAAHHSIEVR